jgi:hypothetical protein
LVLGICFHDRKVSLNATAATWPIHRFGGATAILAPHPLRPILRGGEGDLK